MNKLIFLCALLYAGTNAISQDCSKFYPLFEGVTSQITSYGANQKVAGIIDYRVDKIQKNSGVVLATMNTTIKDKKGKLITETNYEVSCSGDGVSIDFKSMMSSFNLKQFENLETEISGTNLELPNNLSIGQELPDASVNIKINMSGINMETAININNRKVIGKEDVTTPAGTFNCYVIRYNSEVSTMGMNQSSESKQWITEGIGMVKQEDYNKKGKVSSSSLLTAFSK